MDHIAPEPELKQRIMSRRTPGRQYVPARRALTCTLAAVLTLACLFTAALAASPELRTAVLSFFRMEEREQVPSAEQPDDRTQPDVSRADIGQLVKAQYMKMDRYYGFSGSLLSDLTWSEDRRTLLDAKFWEIRDSEPVPVQVDMHTDQVDVTFEGVRYRGELYWFVRNGELSLLKGTPYGIDTRPEDEWYVSVIPGRTDAVLLTLGQGQQMEYTAYPMLYRLDTGEAEDILSGTGVDKLEHADTYCWSEDMRRVLVRCSSWPKNQEWLCDLEAKTLVRLEDLTGLKEKVSACFADSDTLILTNPTALEEDGGWQTVACYVYDIPTGQMTKTLDETQYYRSWDSEKPYGVQLFGSYCVLTGQDRQIRIADLKTGEQTPVEGFTFQKEGMFLISPQGDKLLYFVTDPDTEGLGITQIGVLDMEKRTFIAFDREGYEKLHEGAIGWVDDNTVSIDASVPDGETRYVLLYQF